MLVGVISGVTVTGLMQWIVQTVFCLVFWGSYWYITGLLGMMTTFCGLSGSA